MASSPAREIIIIISIIIIILIIIIIIIIFAALKGSADGLVPGAGDRDRRRPGPD